jgi:hypothetical protein
MTDSPIEVARDSRGRPLPPPGVAPTSLRYALIVPIIAGVVILLYIVANIGTGGDKSIPDVPKIVKGAGLPVASGSPFEAYVTNGEPPSDILVAVVLPADTTKLRALHNRGMPTSFDRSLSFTTSASQAQVYTFFRKQMVGRGWRIFSTAAPVRSDGVQILAQKGGSDSWFWIQGVTISPTTFAGDGTQSTDVVLRLYQASEGA